MNLIASDRAGEADTARLKAIELCAAAGLTLLEGFALAYGGDDGRAAELQADNEALREKLAQREADAGELIERYEEKLTALRGDLEAAQAAHSAYKIIHPNEALHFEYSTTSGVPKL